VGGPSWSEATVWVDGMRELASGGAIGEMLITPFDTEGRFVAPGFSARTIGFEAGRLASVPTSIGVAAGAAKVAPLHATLRARRFNVLVTDVTTAEAILARDRPDEPATAEGLAAAYEAASR